MNLLDLGIKLILFLQGLGDWLNIPMRLFSSLGDEYFYLFVAPALYWCFDAGLGLRMGLILMVNGSLNYVLKLAFHQPRPYWVDPNVKAYAAETSFGLPSGHAQNAVVVWGRLAAWLKGKWAWAVALALMLLIGLSRVYNGVHFPTDVLLGWGVGALVLLAFMALEKPVIKWLKGHSLWPNLGAVTGVSLLLIALSLATRMLLGGWELPLTWETNAKLAAPEAELIDPLALSGPVSSAAAFLGLGGGALLLAHQGRRLEVGGVWWRRLLRYIIGLAGILALYLALKSIFGALAPNESTFWGLCLRYVRYTLIGLWISYLAPLIFIRTRL
jgi:membrane-associated phospholipid phosphatase